MISLDDLVQSNPDAAFWGPLPPSHFNRFCFDSRLVLPGDIFVAVRGLTGNGHDYIDDASRRGASAVLVEATERPLLQEFPQVSAVVVADTVAAMELYGTFVVKAWKPRIVAVTGTVGKTTTKELIADVLSRKYSVFRTPGNYSGRYGLAIALGGLQPDDQIAVIEMATGHFGEMAAMCRITPPEVGVVTAVDAAHLLALEDVDGVAREKGTLISSLPPTGLAILNRDDERSFSMRRLTKAKTMSFGAHPQAEYRSVSTEARLDGTSLIAACPNWKGAFNLPWLGSHSANAALIGLAVADYFDISPDEVVDTLQEIPHVPGRLNPLPGINDSLLLDDSYNATPLSMIAGLQTLSTIAAGKRIAVLGDMDELGSASEAMHRRVGRCASQSVDVLVTKGNEAAWIADEARSSGLNPSQVIVTYTAQDAISAVIASTEPGSSILVKGSASARLESVVGSLLAEPDLASDVLVRQDRAWRNTVVVRPDRPTWLDIELGAVGHNVRTLRSIAQGRELMVVLKGDAYGHGAAQVAHTALFNGASACAVACVPEGRGLRDAGIEAPILVLGYTPGWQAREAVRLSLVLSVFDMRTAAAYSEAAQALNRSVPVRVKVDTGMHRLGVNYQTAAEFVRTVRGLPNLDVTGIFTHFAMADELTERAIRTTDLQIDRFNSVLADLESTGERPPVAHAANSAALLTRPDALYDMVRPGIAVYGLPPAPDIEISGLIPALSWKSQVAQVHSLGPGEHVGYGHEWSSAGESRIATVPVGYADGFRRGPTTWKHILIRGQRAPVIGRVSMDQIGVDVTHVPSVRTGDQAVLIGTQGSEQLPTTQIAEWLGTSVYEVVAEILARVPRVN